MAADDPNKLVRRHLETFFSGHSCTECRWTVGPVREPRLRVAEFAPGPKTGLWVYATLGAWEVRNDPRLEFLILAPERDDRHVELLFMATWYHRCHGLGTGHTVPIGEPSLHGSTCAFLLLSRPYPFGPQLEVCNFTDWHLHVSWLLPISAAEREFKMREGVEALEQRFDACGLEYWVPDRASVV